MALSTVAKTNLFNMIFGKSDNNALLPTCYLGLLTSLPANADGSGYNEPDTAAGYKRAFLGNYQSSNNIMIVKTDLSGELVATNNDIIYFPEATSNWTAVVGWGLFGSADGGNPLFYGNLTQSVTVQQNYVPMFRKDNFVMKIDPVVT